MDFRFNVNNLLPKRINKITHTLIPEGFRGDRREYNDCQRLLTRILDDMGEASAKAQGLNRTITSALKLRDTDHVIYLMVDSDGNNGLGSVVGLLKTGSKTLFMFDENGLHYQIKPRCILDFYIHESRQRMGLGNELYEHMLTEENLKPIKLAIDRPSDKFLAFLKKYYGLESIIPQNNKFVVFKGFFEDEIEERQNNRYSHSPSPHRPSSEHKNQSDSNNDAQSPKNNSINGTPSRSAYGRYAASRPPCSMASIIHNTSPEQPAERTRSRASSAARYEQRPDSLSLYHEEIPKQRQSITTASEIASSINHNEDKNSTTTEPPSLQDLQDATTDAQEEETMITEDANDSVPMANDTAVSVTGESVPDDADKTTINGESVKASSPTCSQEVVAAGATSGGHLDLKFYHSPLW